MKKKILLVENSHYWTSAIKTHIEAEGFAILDAAASTTEGSEFARENHFDAAIIDLHSVTDFQLGEDIEEYAGLEEIRSLNDEGDGFLLIILSARPLPRIEAYCRRNSVFCVKGDTSETLHDITSILKEHFLQLDGPTRIERGTLVYESNRVYIRDIVQGRDHPVDKMSRGELRILRLLMSSDAPLSKHNISQKTNLQESSVESLISRIRRKLEKADDDFRQGADTKYGQIECETTPNGNTLYSLET